MSINVVAVDLGASSGRVILANYSVSDNKLSMREIHRFANGFIYQDGHDCWDLESLYQNILIGLNTIDASGVRIDSIGIDSWGVDFVLTDKHGRQVGQAVSYRDERTDGVPEQVMQRLSQEAIYQRTGIQFLKFNTLYQLQALLNERPLWLDKVERLSFIPDYLHYCLTGKFSCEFTNASTSQLINAQTKDWDPDLTQLLGVAKKWLQPVTHPGTKIGTWQAPSGQQVNVILPATHDTGSAIVATPLENLGAAYISSGTWSLVGIESPTPITNAAALATNLTNEGGVEGTYRILKNVMGLWLVQGLQKEWPELDFATLTTLAEQAKSFNYLIHPNDERFLNPTKMSEAIQSFCQETNQGTPTTAGELVRCVLESLALYYQRVLTEIESVTEQPIHTLHIVGGGSKNHLLNRLCADLCQRTVITGPIEASALGNIGWQLQGLGVFADRHEVRRMIRQNAELATIHPSAVANLAPLRQRFEMLCTHTKPEMKLTEELV